MESEVPENRRRSNPVSLEKGELKDSVSISLPFDRHSILDCFTLVHLGEGDRLARKV